MAVVKFKLGLVLLFLLGFCTPKSAFLARRHSHNAKTTANHPQHPEPVVLTKAAVAVRTDYHEGYQDGLRYEGTSHHRHHLQQSYLPDSLDGRIVRQISMPQCSTHMEILTSLNDVSCGPPLPRMIRLRPPGPNFAILPSVAKVKRCDGHCPHSQSCLPIKKRIIRVPVYQLDRANDTRSCVEFELEEHEECHCACSVLSHHCSPPQIYDMDNCSCKCNNVEERDACYDRQYQSWIWNEKECQCQCVYRDCGHRMVWNPESCRCTKSMDESLDGMDMTIE